MHFQRSCFTMWYVVTITIYVIRYKTARVAFPVLLMWFLFSGGQPSRRDKPTVWQHSEYSMSNVCIWYGIWVPIFGIITTLRLYYFQAQADPVTVQPKSTNETNAGSSDAIVLPPPTYDETPAPNKTGDTDADESTALNNGDKVGYTPGKWRRFVCISDI